MRPSTRRARAQAEALAHASRASTSSASSPARSIRARETASSSRPAERVETDDRLLEMDYGAWEGLTYEDLERDHATARRRWEQAPDILRYPAASPGTTSRRRVRAFLDELLEATSSGTAASRSRRAGARRRAQLDEPDPDVRRAGAADPRVPAAVRPGQANITVLRFEHVTARRKPALLASRHAHLQPAVRPVS
jgi:broad specificity phosphatase PhoE